MKTNIIRNSIVAIAAAFAIGTAWAGPGYGPGTGPRAGTADCPVAQTNQGPLTYTFIPPVSLPPRVASGQVW